jgi:tRNA-specific 2-thiouridylase
MTKPETIAVAMSGGVDSSTVAAMLAHGTSGAGDGGSAAQDYAVVGLTLQLWDQTRLAGQHGIPDAPKAGRCCSLDDVYDARHVAEHLGIPYYVVNQEERFERDVVRPFVEEYMAGRTPIPCSLCNNHLKFDQLLQTARSIGAGRIATGHYAVNEYDPERQRWILKRAADLAKDQTYFLFGLTQEQLAHTLFPLGRLTKPEVREVARLHGLALAEKPDSQEICFIPGGDYKRFLTAYLGRTGSRDRRRTGDLEGRGSGPARGHLQLHRGPAKGTRRQLALAALRAGNRSGEPPRDRGRRRGTSHTHPARKPPELDFDSGADRPDARTSQDSPSPRARLGQPLAGRTRRSPCHLRRTPARRHSRPVRCLL